MARILFFSWKEKGSVIRRKTNCAQPKIGIELSKSKVLIEVLKSTRAKGQLNPPKQPYRSLFFIPSRVQHFVHTLLCSSYLKALSPQFFDPFCLIGIEFLGIPRSLPLAPLIILWWSSFDHEFLRNQCKRTGPMCSLGDLLYRTFTLRI